MSAKNFKLKILSTVTILLLFLAFTLSIITTTSTTAQETLTSSLLITAKTDKETYLLRQKVVIEGNITMDGTPVTDALIIIQTLNPANHPLAYRTISHGNVSQTLPIEITNLYLTDFDGNPVNTVRTGTAAKACMAIYNPQLTPREIFVTITVYDANMVPIQAGYLSTTIQPQKTITPKFTIHTPKWAVSGKAIMCGNVYSKEPKLGGMAYALEKQVYFCISRYQQGYLDLPEIPPPPPQSTPGTYTTYITLQPDPSHGQHHVYATCQVDPITTYQTSTTFNVEQSSGYPPQASFVYWPATPYQNMTVTFDASSSTPEGFNDTITSYEWDFGDGTPKIAKTEPTITHAYQQPETFIVTLNVTDNEGLWSTTSKPITILPEFGPTANFTWTPMIPVINETITFDASSSEEGWCAKTQRYSPITSYAWNFSDGTINTTPTETITHNYTQPENYTVTLTITDADGRTDTISRIIEVQNVTLKFCDINGDGKIDMIDLYLVAKAYGSYPDDPNWNPNADVNKDGKVDMIDLYLVAKNYGKDP